MAALLALQAVRVAAVRASAGGLGQQLWPGHPAVLLHRTMAEIGTRAARGESLPPPIFAQVEQVAAKSPLAPEPFLIHGAVAQLEGDEGRAERLYKEALARNPRSRAAHYFLADRYLRSGRIAAALVEMATFSRLTNTVAEFAGPLAAFARAPGALDELRQLFRTSPELEPVVLSQLALDASNLDLVEALWSGRRGEPGSAEWQARMVAALIDRGDFARARAAWEKFAGVRAPPAGIFNSGFDKLPAPPPFNWSFGSAGGLAEPLGGGRLQLIYYGREEAILAEQVLMLPPGSYRLAMNISGELADGSVAWRIECLPGQIVVLRLPLASRRPQAQAAFAVPAQGCPAQRLRLVGSPGAFPQSAEFTVSGLRLVRAPA